MQQVWPSAGSSGSAEIFGSSMIGMLSFRSHLSATAALAGVFLVAASGLALPSAALAAAETTREQATTSTSPCATATGRGVASLWRELHDEKKFKVVHKDGLYIALQDPSTFAMWTFTREGQSAHPAVVCRVPLRSGEAITLEMVIACEGGERVCAVLKSDFQQLNQRMQLDIENKTGGP